MLQLHDAKHFRFDGELKEEWMLVNTTNDTSFQLGRNKTMQTEEGIINPIFKGIAAELPSLTFEMFKVDYEGEPMEMTHDDLFELNRWLDRNEPKPLEVDGYIYWGMFSPQSGVWYPNRSGRIELKFDMILPYMLGGIVNDIYYIDNEENIIIENDSNVYGDYVYPDIEIKVISGATISIFNKDNEQKITLSNLDTDTTYVVYNQERQMVNLSNPKDLVYSNSNKEYMNLECGDNRIKITTDGEAMVRFIYQPKICLQ